MGVSWLQNRRDKFSLAKNMGKCKYKKYTRIEKKKAGKLAFDVLLKKAQERNNLKTQKSSV